MYFQIIFSGYWDYSCQRGYLIICYLQSILKGIANDWNFIGSIQFQLKQNKWLISVSNLNRYGTKIDSKKAIYCGQFDGLDINGIGVYIEKDIKWQGSFLNYHAYYSGIRYINDFRYVGELIKSQLNGQGSVMYRSQWLCCGQFQNDQRIGKGHMITNDGVTYKGQVYNGIPDEEKFIYENSFMITVFFLSVADQTIQLLEVKPEILNGICQYCFERKPRKRINKLRQANDQISITQSVVYGTSTEYTTGQHEQTIIQLIPNRYALKFCDGYKLSGYILNYDFSQYVYYSFLDTMLFEGQCINSKFNGKGYMMNNNSSFYNGDWLNGERHGFGIYINDHLTHMGQQPDKPYKLITAYKSLYFGRLKQGSIQGYGILICSLSNTTYCGSFKEGQVNGYGIKISGNQLFKGYFINGKEVGYGIQKDRCGQILKGYFKNGDLITGFIQDDLGNKYVGGCLNKQANGFGTCIQHNRIMSLGQWSHGYQYGQGIQFSDQECYKGQFQNTKYGLGIMWYDDKEPIYLGDWIENQRHGFGSLSSRKNVLFTSQWQKDHPNGYGYITEKFECYEGFLVKGQKQGKGRIRYENNVIFYGDWIANQQEGFGIEIQFDEQIILYGKQQQGVFSGQLIQYHNSYLYRISSLNGSIQSAYQLLTNQGIRVNGNKNDSNSQRQFKNVQDLSQFVSKLIRKSVSYAQGTYNTNNGVFLRGIWLTNNRIKKGLINQ